MKPKLPITDKRFVWTPSHSTDIRELFERVRAQQKAEMAAVTRKLNAIVPLKREASK